jgi:hypothetical protein
MAEFSAVESYPQYSHGPTADQPRTNGNEKRCRLLAADVAITH